jgi:hypothetical protein
MMARLVALFVTAYQPISKARVIAGDLKTVGVDFSATPLDEILDFRRQYGSEYRSYARNLRRFTFELSLMNEGDQAFAMEERAQELEDNAEDLRRRARRAYKRPAIALAFGIAGAALMLSSGDPLAAAVEASAAIALFDTRDPMPISFSYSYIFRARGQLLR